MVDEIWRMHPSTRYPSIRFATQKPRCSRSGVTIGSFNPDRFWKPVRVIRHIHPNQSPNIFKFVKNQEILVLTKAIGLSIKNLVCEDLAGCRIFGEYQCFLFCRGKTRYCACNNTFSHLFVLVDNWELAWICSDLPNNTICNFDKIKNNLVVPIGLKVIEY